MKTGSILIDFDGIFPMKLSEFIISVNFGSNLKKLHKKPKIVNFLHKNDFYRWKNIFFYVL